MPVREEESNIKALILSCNTGEGHNSCASAVEEFFTDRGVSCETADALAFISKGISNIISKGHVFMYRHAPWLFRRSYHYSESHEELFSEGSATYRLMASGASALHDYIVKKGFDTVICPHIFPALMMTELLKDYPTDKPVSCFIGTDYTCSPGTAEADMDIFFMPHMSPSEHELPLDMHKVIFSGIPVRQSFYSICPKAEAREKCGIPKDKKHLLVMCGSMGCGPMKRLVFHLSRELREDDFVTVVCGTNRRLELTLRLFYSRRPNIKIMGYARNMSLLMDSADLYLTKPGGISTSEASVKALPMVLIDAVSGCEKYNRDYMTASGLALTDEGTEKLARLCSELLHDEERLNKMRQAGRAMQTGNSARLIYDELNKLHNK